MGGLLLRGSQLRGKKLKEFASLKEASRVKIKRFDRKKESGTAGGDRRIKKAEDGQKTESKTRRRTTSGRFRTKGKRRSGGGKNAVLCSECRREGKGGKKQKHQKGGPESGREEGKRPADDSRQKGG